MGTALVAAAAACGDDEGGGGGGGVDGGSDVDGGGNTDSDRYEFDSRFVDGESSVSYSGQVLRQVLISDLTSYVDGLTTTPLESFPADVEGDLLLYYRYNASTSSEAMIQLSADLPLLQTTYGEVGDAMLENKLAGNDAMGQHKDWSTDGNFVGWPDNEATSPQALALFYFGEIDRLADQFAAGNAPDDPNGVQIDSAYVDANGRDYKQLTQKFLLGAITYSQASDDYWDDDIDDHGINVANDVPNGDGDPYSSLEHHWDEGFGYMGAARDYLEYSDEQLASGATLDTNRDGKIDLKSEMPFGISVNAAKRDLGSSAEAPTDFTAELFTPVLEARRLIASTDGNLTGAQMEQLQDYRNQAVLTWEKIIAATIIHYINETLQDMASFEDGYVFLDHAKHWSELKGFALGLQFNPRKQLTDQQFADLHGYIGDVPVLPTADPSEITAYKEELIDARDMLADIYDFDAANIGDANGENGW